jgi:hypothetical protein
MRFTRRGKVGLVCGGALFSLFLLIGQYWLMRELSWTHREPPTDSLIGFNFSCDQAEYLLLEDPAKGVDGYVPDARPGRNEWCASVLDTLFTETGAHTVRLSLQWDDIEPREGTFDFSLTDALIASAARNQATVMLTVGMKAQRDPEFYIPDWARVGVDTSDGTVLSDSPLLRQRALTMVAEAVQHFASSPVIDSWGAENEAYISSDRAAEYSLSREYVGAVVATIRANDPERRPVSINHAQHFVMDRRWQTVLADSDILGQSMYPARNVDVLGLHLVVDIMQIGPLMPNYAYQARQAKAMGKPFWVTELQAEPWTDEDSRLITPAHPSSNLDPAGLLRNVRYARQTGAQRIYLWGAEWWLYEQRLGDDSWLAAARSAVASARSE